MGPYIGLNEWAKNFVKGEEVLLYTTTVKHVYPDGTVEETVEEKRGPNIKREQLKPLIPVAPMPGMELPLFKYTFPDGSVYREEAQLGSTINPSCFFIALRDGKDGWVEESLWSEGEIALVNRILSQ